MSHMGDDDADAALPPPPPVPQSNPAQTTITTADTMLPTQATPKPQVVDNLRGPRTEPKSNGKRLTPEQLAFQEQLKQWQFIVREVPTDELIFDEEGLPYVSNEDLEVTIRTLQLFYRFPQVAMAGTYTKNTYENFMYQQARSNAMRWLKPADAPAVRDILALIKVQEQNMLQSTGIRNERNRKKKLLPRQCGQVYINHNDHELLMYNQAQKAILTISHQNEEGSSSTGAGTINDNAVFLAETTTNQKIPTTNQHDGVVSLNSQAIAPIQKMIKIHGIDAFTTHNSLPETAKLNHVLDNDSTVIKGRGNHNISLQDIRKNFTPITKDSINQIAQRATERQQQQPQQQSNKQVSNTTILPSHPTTRKSAPTAGTDDSDLSDTMVQQPKRQRGNNTIQSVEVDCDDPQGETKTIWDDANDNTQMQMGLADLVQSTGFLRPRHAQNFDTHNPQPKSLTIDRVVKRTNSPLTTPPCHHKNESNSNPLPASIRNMKQLPGGFSTVHVEEITYSDDIDESRPQSPLTTSQQPQQLGVPSQPHHPALKTTNDTTIIVGLPTEAEEMIKETQLDSQLLNQLPKNPNSKFSKSTKQQTKDWASKRGLYGGAVDFGTNNIDLDGEEFQMHTGISTDQSTMGDRGRQREDDQNDDDLYEEDELLKTINNVFNSQLNSTTKHHGPFDQDDVDQTGCQEDDIDQDPTTTTTHHNYPPQQQSNRTLRKPITCYVCKASFTQLHHFYDRMCPPCASFNYKKRFQTAPMAITRLNPVNNQSELIRRVCLVTGARVKIGYEIVLKLLRAGAFVIATSRFPIDTALRLTQEADFAAWEDNIHVYGIDLRVVSSVELFIKHILATYPRLDMIMNNAAQTIRRPPQFYRHLLTVESQPIEAFDIKVDKLVKDFIPKAQRQSAQNTQFTTSLLLSMGVNEELVKKTVPGSELLLTHTQSQTNNFDLSTTEMDTTVMAAESATTTAARQVDVTKDKLISLFGDNSVSTNTTTATTTTNNNNNNNNTTLQLANGLSSSSRLLTMLSLPQAAAIPASLLTQIPLVAGDEDKVSDKEIFPLGIYDKDHQQLDLRPQQTWVLKAEEVSMVEMQEVQTVNATIPFMLNIKLKPLLTASRGDPSWIINVSSMEGKFRGHKDITHPHTNMAKAALNMFTHTSARDFAVDNIFMNAVDTGWVTEELPHGIAVHKAQIGFAPPLDEIDGAARCLDPVFTSLLTGVYEYGKFFKDYAEGHW